MKTGSTKPPVHRGIQTLVVSREVRVTMFGIHAIYTCHDSDHIIHWIIALCQFILTGAAGKQGSPNAAIAKKCIAFISLCFQSYGLCPQQSGGHSRLLLFYFVAGIIKNGAIAYLPFGRELRFRRIISVLVQKLKFAGSGTRSGIL